MLVDMMLFVGRGQYFAFVDIIYPQRLDQLSFHELADARL